ncbi:probable G-protein coupled receptor 139 [Amblyraja radiata]|uniref:probable G-protein coupled receptor 139 n=1 Tax=Amblyraja radiata TaxID=386614 RepID=UPI00140410FB|nr:probable G-protein coupled receptor 139 [Amblyraja radiata]
MAIVILSRGKCGLSRCITLYLVAMATADLMVIFTDVILYTIISFHFPGTYMDTTPARSLLLVLLSAATDVSVWLTVTFTFDRFVAICCQKLRSKYCTTETATVVLTVVSVVLSLKNIPLYFIYEPEYIVDDVPWGNTISLSFYTETAWVAFDLFCITLTPCFPFLLILLLNALTVRSILVTGKIRRRLQKSSNCEDRNDPEMEKRRKSIILLFTISGSFVVLWMTRVLHFLYYRITNKHDLTGPGHIAEQTGYMLQLLSSCTNTCIYVVTQTRFREQLRDALLYPFTAVVAWFH